jgi:hypothetical protein
MKRLGRIESIVYDVQFKVLSLCETIAKKL